MLRTSTNQDVYHGDMVTFAQFDQEKAEMGRRSPFLQHALPILRRARRSPRALRSLFRPLSSLLPMLPSPPLIHLWPKTISANHAICHRLHHAFSCRRPSSDSVHRRLQQSSKSFLAHRMREKGLPIDGFVTRRREAKMKQIEVSRRFQKAQGNTRLSRRIKATRQHRQTKAKTLSMLASRRTRPPLGGMIMVRKIRRMTRRGPAI
ncbi:MAG: hypothetical protein Q9202_001299 [Teloschistes flavicans]